MLLLGALGSSMSSMLELRDCLAAAAADLGENVYRSHVEERLAWEEHLYACGSQLALRGIPRLQTETWNDLKMRHRWVSKCQNPGSNTVDTRCDECVRGLISKQYLQWELPFWTDFIKISFELLSYFVQNQTNKQTNKSDYHSIQVKLLLAPVLLWPRWGLHNKSLLLIKPSGVLGNWSHQSQEDVGFSGKIISKKNIKKNNVHAVQFLTAFNMKYMAMVTTGAAAEMTSKCPWMCFFLRPECMRKKTKSKAAGTYKDPREIKAEVLQA